ncbi:MAG: ABC transporter permease [Erysipelotrichaceae bacterium]|jgi:peptide/nickel transport system permease protein|nr:ABC transporter permease [Erysipelotrichaceae bacterium]
MKKFFKAIADFFRPQSPSRKAFFERVVTAIKRNAQLRIGLILLAVLLFVAFGAGLLTSRSPYYMYDDLKQAPNSTYLLGTDGLGRDVYTMIVYGTRVSLMIGIVAASISGIIGTMVGAIAGYFGGKVDRFVVEFINIFVMTPSFFLILIIIALFGSSITNVMLVLGLTSWTGNARLMRAQAISIKERVFIKSAKVIGEGNWKIMFKHVIPNGIFPVIANTTMNVSGAILSEASLSFLGLGDPNVVSWGQMISHGKTYMSPAPWISISAGIAIVFTVLTFFLLGEGLKNVLSPKLQNVQGGE